ncbi:MAG: hypothetical protein AAF292_02235 [Pseudomonadota bacterium]
MILVVFSLILNVIITTILPPLMLRASPSMDAVYGPDTDARRILACLYGTIALASIFALAALGAGFDEITRQIVWVLFPLQIAYKLATIPTVGLSSPVVRTNLFVVIVHSVALLTLWQS